MMLACLLITLLQLTSLPDSGHVLERSAARTGTVRPVEASDRSALQLFAPHASYSSLGAGWYYRNDPAPWLVQEGGGLSEGRLNVRSLLRPDSLSVVQGSVQYTNGIKRTVRWNSTSDYLLVYPYALADSVGGDLRREEYRFSGGYARRLGRFHFGVDGAYRATHEFRQTDPRPRNIVSDLSLTLSAGVEAGGEYVLDMAAAWRRYAQSHNVDFYNSRGANTVVFHLTGLGGHYARLASTSAYTTGRYGGDGLQLSAALEPKGCAPWQMRAVYGVMDMRHYLSRQNETPSTELLIRRAHFRLRYLGRTGELSWRAGAHAGLSWRQGIESVLDNESAGRFQDLMQLLMFRSRQGSAGLDAALEQRSASRGWEMAADVRFKHFSADYAYPERRLSVGAAALSLEAGAHVRKGTWLLLGRAESAVCVPVTGVFAWPGEAGVIPALAAQYAASYELARKPSVRLGLSFGAESALRRTLSLWLRPSGGVLLRKGEEAAVYGSLTTGINF